MDNLTDEELSLLANKHIGWIHSAEQHLGKRLSTDQIRSLLNLLYVNGWEDFISIQQKKMQEWEITRQQIQVALENWTEAQSA